MTNSNYKFQFNFSGNTNPSYYLYLNKYGNRELKIIIGTESYIGKF